ncbi:hypothetical protein LX32DRAFT_637474 [Colletotrichum zoysiae]|uniref:Uncharacterized protein n=1 Tax=Colletotrichum zoysiae TaxID=1216348 RepID=A0AAD9HLM9_9PEZI|nr:hypothetical protein LX32DRAFT_637474 [Colletotrichum zoysiae]
MSVVETSAQILTKASVVALLAACIYHWLWGPHLSQQQRTSLNGNTQHQRRFRDLTLRVDLVPPGKSFKELESELKSVIAGSPDLQGQLDDLVVRSITPRDRTCVCATATVRTLLPEEQLLARLQQASKAYPYRYDCAFYGITPLYEDASGAYCDVVAVPGLASHAIGSWKSPGGNDLWLRDWLSDDVRNIRVLLYGYDTKLLKSNAKSSVEDLGRSFLESLTAFRTSDKALIHAVRSPANCPTHRLLSQVCRGVLFFGVPQLGLRNEKLASMIEGQPNQALINALVVDDESEPSAFLFRMSDDFAQYFRGLRVVSFYERRLSATVEMQPDGSLRKSGPPVLMVTRSSATISGLNVMSDEEIVPLDADHSGLVKFESRRDDAYVVVKERIGSLVSSAASRTQGFPWAPASHRGSRIVATQQGSVFGGQYITNGGISSQGNVMNL